MYSGQWWLTRPELIPVSVAWSDQEYFYSPLNGMLVHRRVTPSVKFAGTHLYTWVEGGIVRIKCLAQEHNTMSPVRARTRTAYSGVQCTNHEATAPSHGIRDAVLKCKEPNFRSHTFQTTIGQNTSFLKSLSGAIKKTAHLTLHLYLKYC